MNSYLKVWQNYSEFSGRSSRMEYWMFNLIQMLIYGLGYALIFAMAISSYFILTSIIVFLLGIYAIAYIIPSLALSVRRLHDVGKSGWLILINLIPFVGVIILLVFLFSDGIWGDNQYGPNPKSNVNQGFNSPYNQQGYYHSHHYHPAASSDLSPQRKESIISSKSIQHKPHPQVNHSYENKLIFPITIYQQNGEFAGKTYHITGTIQGNHYEAILGWKTAHSNPDIAVNDSIVSRRHISLLIKDHQFFAQLLAAKNATFINNQRLEPGQYYPIYVGDLIYIGEVQFKVLAG